MIEWHIAPTRRQAFYADSNGPRLFVEQTVRSERAHGLVGTEFQAWVSGIRVGDYRSLDEAQTAAVFNSRPTQARRTIPCARDTESA